MTEAGPDPSLASASEYKLLGDEPYCVDDDPLGFDEIAAHLTDLVLRARSSSPFTLGIEGGWGTGKSSLMRRIQPRLQAQPGIATVWFNAWAVEDGQALEGLIKSVMAELDPSVLRRAARNQQLMGSIKLASTLLAGWFGVGRLVDSIWSALDVDPKARNDLQALMKSAMDDWIAKAPDLDEGRLLVVFIDDLDRCSPDNVFQIFEAIKVHMNTTGMVFVVGYDKDIVAQGILRKKHYAKGITGTDYLEKIIQVSYRVPRPSETAGEKLIDAYLSESGTMALFTDSTLKKLAIERNTRNPRRIKRFINAFILEWGLDPEWARENFDPAIVVRVVILYMYFAEFALLLEASSGEDPVEKFEHYRRVRAALWRKPSADDESWDMIRDFVIRYDLRAIEAEGDIDHQAILTDIQTQMPPCFSRFVGLGDFAELLGGLGGDAERDRLLTKLRRTAPSVRSEAEPAAPDGEMADLQPLPAPSGSPPYRLAFDEVAGAERADRITKQGALVFHVTGSTGGVKVPEIQRAVASAMIADFDAPETAPAFLYLLGDLVHYDGRAENYFPQFYEPYAHYEAPIFAIPGNHDASNSDDPSRPPLAAFVDNFCARTPHRTAAAGDIPRDAMTQPNVYWTLTAPFLTFVGLYTNLPTRGHLDGPQIEWLVGELKAAPADRALVLALHHDPFSASQQVGGSAVMSRALDDAFARSGRLPDLVLSAHVHNYQRFTRTLDGREVAYVVAGAGGYHNLHRMTKGIEPGTQIDDIVLEQFCADRWGFLRVRAAPDGLDCQYVALNARGRSPEAAVVDAFRLPVRAGADADALAALAR